MTVGLCGASLFVLRGQRSPCAGGGSVTLHPMLCNTTFTGIYNLAFISKARAMFPRILENYGVVFQNARERCAKVAQASPTHDAQRRCNEALPPPAQGRRPRRTPTHYYVHTHRQKATL